MDQNRVGPALGKISSGLYIATGVAHGEPVGMLCSFVEQASFDPPMLSLAIAPGRPITAVLDAREPFGLHVLSKQNNGLLKSFARGSTPESFAAHELVANEFNVPQFAEAWAFLVARVVTSMPAGDHLLYLAEVLDGTLQHAGHDANVRVRPNGFTY
ncbi:MAG: flavin reductase family protein [Chthoniobacteraceae bacterium]